VPCAESQSIPITRLVHRLSPTRKGGKGMALFWFFCDESYDSDPAQERMVFHELGAAYVPATYVVAGFFADELTWTDVEGRWSAENRRVGVSRYHAAEVNAFGDEFAGWEKDKQIAYSANLVKILTDQKRRLHAVSCGIFSREYEQIIGEGGRKKFGHPYIVCFKSCIAMLAQEMEIRNFEPEDKFAVILGRNSLENEAIKVFTEMQDNPNWRFGRRLAFCARGNWQDFVPLQTADLIAYETFRLLHEKHKDDPKQARWALRTMFPENGFLGHYYEAETLQRIKEPLENAACAPNGFVVVFPPVTDSTGEGRP